MHWRAARRYRHWHPRLPWQFTQRLAGRGGYERIAEAVLGGLKVDHFLLEYDDERSGDFAPLRHVPLEDLAISPQCGFASTVEGNLITPEDQWRKLERVVEVAQRVWGGATMAAS